jgi:hypothetical protein
MYDMSNSSVVATAFTVVGRCLPSHYLAMAVSSDNNINWRPDTKKQQCDLMNLLLFLVYFPKFENIKGGLGNHFVVCVYVRACACLRWGGGLVEQGEIVIAKQLQHEHILASINMIATIKKCWMWCFLSTPQLLLKMEVGDYFFSEATRR